MESNDVDFDRINELLCEQDTLRVLLDECESRDEKADTARLKVIQQELADLQAPLFDPKFPFGYGVPCNGEPPVDPD